MRINLKKKRFIFYKLILHTTIFLTALSLKANPFCASNSNLLSFKNSQFDTSLASQKSKSSIIKVLSWNVYKLSRLGIFNDIKNLTLQSDIVFLQEGLHTPAWQAAFSTHFMMNWSFHKSFCNSNDEATGVLTGSKYTLENSFTLHSPLTEPITNTPKASGFSLVTIHNKKVLLVNTHALNFNLGSAFEAHINQTASHIQNFKGPVIWAGDFNTWSAERLDHLEKVAKKLKLSFIQPTHDNRWLKLDHILVRGFAVRNTQLHELNTSDHWPLTTELTLNEP